MSGDERLKPDVDSWATVNAEISIAAVNIKTCPRCGEPTMKVPNSILCSATGELVQEVKSK